MDNKNMTEKESWELITHMIQNAKYKMAENAGMPFLIWGYLCTVISLVIWFLLKETGNYNWQWMWFLLPAISFPATLWINRKKQKMARTYIDRILGYVWTVFGLGGFLITWVAIFYWSLPVLFIILLIMGMGTALTGLIGALSSLGCLFIHGFDQILLFALAFIFMMVIPGHFLNYKVKKGGGA